MIAKLKATFDMLAEGVDDATLRLVDTESERISVRNGSTDPTKRSRDRGLMVHVIDKGGVGYAATSQYSCAGVRDAFLRALQVAHASAQHMLFDAGDYFVSSAKFEFSARSKTPWSALTLREKLDRCRSASSCKNDSRLVHKEVGVWFVSEKSRYFTSRGADISRELELMSPSIQVIASEKGESHRRSYGEKGRCLQGGVEVLESTGFDTAMAPLALEALALLSAPQCPSERMSLLLHPDQMLLQIHESIGHPLELDRILGDERNFAGTSFVTLDMFGNYTYGSPLLNVAFDPEREGAFANYSHDDEGCEATKEYVIKDGLLLRPLGGKLSQARSALPGVAASRASGWNRAPIDRMSNLNVEPGESSLDDMIRNTERGIFMRTNRSWSIDDSRNKFQFGCESAQLIENGELTHVVKNPNYRGISKSFWRSLSAVGDENTFALLGEPYCGKGEPNQLIRVGHASPVCKFDNIDVFGGAK